MPRDIAAIATEVAAKTGTQPINIIEVDWLGGTRYADKNFGGVPGKILTIAGIDSLETLGSSGTAGSLSFVIDDTDGTIKAVMDTVDVLKIAVKVYQTYDNLSTNDLALLFTGEISTPIVWDEGARTVSFTVETIVEDNQIGFSPEEGEFDFIAESAVGVAWPLCFGEPVRVPAVKITDAMRGSSLTRYGAVSYSELQDLCARAAAWVDASITKDFADVNPGFSDENYAVVVDNVTETMMALNSLREQLIIDSPTSETNIRSYITACYNLRLAERNLAFGLADYAAAEAEIETQQAIVDSTSIQLMAAQMAVPQDPTLIASLQATLSLAEDTLSDAENDKIYALLLITASNDNIVTYTTEKETLETALVRIALTEIIVEGGEKFPQGTAVDIIAANMKFNGVFTGKTFAVLAANLSVDTNISTTSTSNYDELVLPNTATRLKGKFCRFSNGILYCEDQDGTRCSMSPILYEQTGALPALENVLVNGEPVVREIFDPVSPGMILETTVYVPLAWVKNLQSETSRPDFSNGLSKLQSSDWSLEIGDEIYLASDFQQKYIANLIPSTEIKEVVAFRTINGIEQIYPVPTEYFISNLDEEIAGRNATTLTLIRPLTAYDGEGWSDRIFVTLISSEGPNIADIIQYLLETYSDITVDTASFAAVAGHLDGPSHFAILDRPTVLKTVESIAWQARSVLFTMNGEAFLKYLAAYDTSEQSLSETDVLHQTLQLTTTAIDNIVTELRAQWTDDYSKEEENELILRNNIPKYGRIIQDCDFFIYNIKTLVEKSATFWIIRLSNTWKRLKFTGFLNVLKLVPFDRVQLDFAAGLIGGSPPHQAVVKVATFNSLGHEIEIEVEAAIQMGEDEEHPLYFPDDNPTTKYPTPFDSYTGGAA